jgi:TRAP-type mannitol/chloroaromatic compound transport system substrate-binding protein
MVEVGCNDADLWLMGAGEARQGDAVEFHKQHGVQIHEWPKEFLDAFKKAWEEVAEAEAAADPRFKEIYEHYKAFRAKYAAWRELGYLK